VKKLFLIWSLFLCFGLASAANPIIVKDTRAGAWPSDTVAVTTVTVNSTGLSINGADVLTTVTRVASAEEADVCTTATFAVLAATAQVANTATTSTYATGAGTAYLAYNADNATTATIAPGYGKLASGATTQTWTGLNDYVTTPTVNGVRLGTGSGSGGATALSALTDVSLTSKTTGQSLAWSGTHWTNTTITGGSSGGATVYYTSGTLSSGQSFTVTHPSDPFPSYKRNAQVFLVSGYGLQPMGISGSQPSSIIVTYPTDTTTVFYNNGLGASNYLGVVQLLPADGATGPQGETGATGAAGPQGLAGEGTTLPSYTGNAGKVLTVDVGETTATWQTASVGLTTVTLVDHANTADMATSCSQALTTVTFPASVTSLSALTDVALTSQTSGEVLAWDGAAWTNTVAGAGSQGPQGIPGDKGTTGTQGVAGNDGAAATISVGTVTTGTAAVTNVGTTSTAVFDFIIPKGDTGSAGAGGAQGPQGVQGIQGPQGDKGTTGTQGVKGDTGDTGATGAQGIQGIQGLTGDTGTTGTQGVQGEQGIQGIQGLTGDKGTTGTQGTDGTNGTNGTNGVDLTPLPSYAGNAGKVLTVAVGETTATWQTSTGSGGGLTTVTLVERALSADTATTCPLAATSSIAYVTSTSFPVGNTIYVTHAADPFPQKRTPSFLANSLLPSAWWNLNEFSGLPGTQFFAEFYGGTAMTMTGGPTLTSGTFGNCLTFVTGSSQYAGSATSFSAKTAFSIDMWVNRTAAAATKNIYSVGATYNSGTPFIMLRDASGTLTYYVGGNYNLQGGTLTDSTWTHLTLTWDGVNWRSYKNGVLVSSYYSVGSYQSTATSLFLSSGAGGYWGGSIDNVMVYDSALLSSQIPTTESPSIYSGFPVLIGMANGQIQAVFVSDTVTAFINNLSATISGTAIVKF